MFTIFPVKNDNTKYHKVNIITPKNSVDECFESWQMRVTRL